MQSPALARVPQTRFMGAPWGVLVTLPQYLGVGSDFKVTTRLFCIRDDLGWHR